MADYNLKSITADTDGPSADTELLFGSPDQSSGTPKPYSFAGIKAWSRSWGDSAYAARRYGNYVAGRYYFCPDITPTTGTGQSINTVYCFPFVVYQNITVSELAMRVGTLQAAKNATAAIYANVAATMRPGNILAAGNSIATQFDLGTVSNQAQALTSNATLVAGVVYWMCYNSNGTTAVAAGAYTTGAMSVGGTIADLWNSGQANSVQGVTTPLTYTTTWPDLTSATWTVISAATANSIMPNIAFKVASVP